MSSNKEIPTVPVFQPGQVIPVFQMDSSYRNSGIATYFLSHAEAELYNQYMDWSLDDPHQMSGVVDINGNIWVNGRTVNVNHSAAELVKSDLRERLKQVKYNQHSLHLLQEVVAEITNEVSK